MVQSGICCANLKDNKALMKMGLGLVLVGHVNFLLGALVHGVVYRHITVRVQAPMMVYAVSNVIAIVAGLLGIISGIVAIVLSKNKKNRTLQWVLLVFGFLAGLIALAAAVALSVSVVEAIIYQGESLLKQCNFKDSDDADSSSSITYECPFDPTRLYSTTIILWVPLILMCVVEMVFSFRCSAVCCSFLYLCPCRRKPTQARRVRIQKAVEVPPRPPAEDGDSDTAAEPAEQEELLDSGAAAEQSDWL
ncbi:transmembrane protein 54a [Takifugu flavidus]|uniref:transmembrane protein 54a n=1 Tax=Takifugu flavidus TaxID=433684 RepID=UPI002544CBA5|nr:transmembrane protein 54a [Takifugu flavidus]